MSTKAQLAEIFAAEIEDMRDHLEILEMSARRMGYAQDISQIESDIEVGWTYRLFELYGPSARLSFEQDCPARALLRENGVSDEHIDNIAATFRSEQSMGRRGFENKELMQRMESVGLPDTPINRERAMREIFRAKAEVLLDTSSRYPVVNRALSALIHKESSSYPVRSPAASNSTTQSDADAGSHISPSVLKHGFDQPSSTQEFEKEQALQTGPKKIDESVKSTDGDQYRDLDRLGPKSLAIVDFMTECDNLISNHRDDWASDTASDIRVLVGIFVGILQEHSIVHSGQITQQHIAALRQHFNHIPTNYGQSSRLRALSTAALRAVAASQTADAARMDLTPPKIGLSSPTIRRHLGNLDHFLKHLRASHYKVADWDLDGLRPRKPKRGEIRRKQVKPTPDQVRPIFDMPLFTGCDGDLRQDIPGDAIIHSANYFLPMLFAYLGGRRFEFAGLTPADIKQTKNGWAIHIQANSVRRIKNPQSDRLLPIPTEVIRLGFLDYVASVKELGHERLFPELFSPFADQQDPGDRFYKDFVPLVRKSSQIGEMLWQRSIHALRHGLADTLKQGGVDVSVIEDISGRLGTTESDIRYTNPAGLPLLREKLALYPVITDHLQRAPIRLLKWVEANQPPPWAGRKKKRQAE